MENKMRFDVSTGTILKIIAIIAAVWLLYVVRDVVILFFIVLVVVAALAPLVDKMSRHMPRILSVIILAIIFVGILTAIGFLVFPPLIYQISQLAVNLPFIVDKFGPIYHSVQANLPNFQDNLLNLSSQIGNITTGIYSTTLGFITGLVALVTIIVLTFYMLIEKNSVEHFLGQMLPGEHKEKIALVYAKISDKMGGWLRGHAALMLIIGLLDGIALSVLGVPYALTLAIWGGFSEIIPYIGPWLGMAPAVIIAYTISPIKGLLVLILFLLIQQLEAQFLTPKIIGKAVGLSPVIIILALLVGAKLMGILGVIIAVPAAAGLSVIFQEWPELKKLKS